MAGRARGGASEVPVVERLVDAALGCLGDLSAAELVQAIGVREIARRAGTSTSSVYHHFGDVDGLASHLVDRIFDPDSHLGALPSTVVLEAGLTELGATLERYRASLRHLIDDPDFALRFGMWAIGDADLQQRYANWLMHLEDALCADPGTVPGGEHLELRPPVDRRSLVAAFVGLRHGMALRQVVDPHPDRVDHFAMAYVALAATLQRQSGDTHDADARLAEINHFPLDRRRGPAAPETASRAARRARVLDAAEQLLGERGYSGVTLDAVAVVADETTAVTHALIGGKHALAVAVVRRRIAALPARPGSGPEALRDTLLDAAAVAVEARGYLQPYALDLALDAPGVADDPLVRRLGALVSPEQALAMSVLLLQAVLSAESALDIDDLVDGLLPGGGP